jgi:cytochrome c peroxidase
MGDLGAMRFLCLITPALLAAAESLPIPAGLDAYMPVPENNLLTREKVELGKKLFFDPRLSRDNTISCATCHDPKRAFSDSRPTASGIGGRSGKRRVPRLVNRGYGKSFFWDGRAASLEEQVMQPIKNPNEMDLTFDEAGARVNLPIAVIQQALASYVRTILSGDSPYDRYLQGAGSALTPEERLGYSAVRLVAPCVT